MSTLERRVAGAVTGYIAEMEERDKYAKMFAEESIDHEGVQELMMRMIEECVEMLIKVNRVAALVHDGEWN